MSSYVARINPWIEGSGIKGAGSEDEDHGSGNEGAGVRMMTSLPVGVGSLPVMTFVNLEVT